MLMIQSQYPNKKAQLTAIESRILAKGLDWKPDVQKYLASAYNTRFEYAFELAVRNLKLIIEDYDTKQMRNPDEFRPYCPDQLSKSGDLYLIDQTDGRQIFIDHNKLTTGLGIFGPQGCGKSCWLMLFCSLLIKIVSYIKITIIDPKGAFSNLANFSHIDISDASFDLTPPSNVTFENFVYELMPILSNTVGLIYALELLQQAVDIAFEQRRQYIARTGTDPGISLKDISDALSLIRVYGYRKTGYQDGATTALSLILGRRNLFSCRKGLSLDWLFSQNAVLNARSLTDDMQCRFFATYMLYWLYQKARYTPETNQVKHIIIIDDSTRFIGHTGNQFDGGKTSPLGHILAVLRSTGTCLVFATQLPAMVDPSVLSLTRNALVIGNINGWENLKVLQSMMSLTDRQTQQIVRFKQRETLAFISGHEWPLIHGWTPDVNPSEHTTANPYKPVLDIIKWHSLADTPCKPAAKAAQQETVNDMPKTPISMNSADKLALDAIHYPFAKAKEHADKLGSIREYDIAKTQALQDGLLIASECGKSVYLIATQAAYDKFGIVNPYKRATSIEHAFFVRLAADKLKRSGFTVGIETPIGAKGATIDVTTSDKSGNMTAFEVTLSTSNLSSNASKLQDTAYGKIVWLCRDDDTVKAVKGYFNKQQVLPKELAAKFVYVHFSKWIKELEVKNAKA